MMYNDAVEQALASAEKKTTVVSLGKVTSVSGGRATITHYGESDPSIKQYTTLDGYFPQVNDEVVLLKQANTYIILGKIIKSAPVQVWAYKDHDHDDRYLKLEYKNKLEDSNETLTFTGGALIPATSNLDDLGSSSKYFKAVYLKKLVLDGEEITAIREDRIEVKSNGVAYSLIATVSAGYVTLTPSTDDRWKLGTKTNQLSEAWLGLFRGTWKSGQATERAISWNSSNALIPDNSNAVDLGSSNNKFKQLFLNELVGAKFQYQSGSANNIAWESATALIPSSTNVVDFGSASKQFNKVYAKEFYIDGVKLDISGITLDMLTATYNSNTRTLKLTGTSSGATLLPNVNNQFELGSSNYKFKVVVATKFTGDLDGKILNGNYNLSFDSSHNLIPDTNNYISLGTSNKQYKNIYGQNLYANGTAVTSDKRLKEEIEPLDDKHVEFFKNLKPVSFKYKDGTSGRKHTGFIAQDVEEAVEEAGFTDKDMAVVVQDKHAEASEGGQYYLRYEEIIAVQTKVIQDLMARVESLEARVNKLESERRTS